MNKIRKQLVAITAALCLALALSVPALAATQGEIKAALDDTAAYMLRQVPAPQVGSIGGEWAVIGLARSGAAVPAGYFDSYYSNAVKTVQSCQGMLHDKKYTEYSRLILALTAIGRDPSDVGGYNLLTPLGDYDKTVWQGINGPIFALIALDSGNYAIPVNSAARTQATRELYLKYILDAQLTDGGWTLSGKTADPDMTAMALQALSRYQNKSDVKAATDKALSCLSLMQDANGSYSSWSTANSESTAQVIVAVTSLGLDISDSRFVKNGHTLADGLLQYYVKGAGFTHTAQAGGGNDQMSSEQGLYALAALQRAAGGQTPLYDMSDVSQGSGPVDPNPGKHPDVKPQPVVDKSVTFSDVSGHANRTAIQDLASRQIINGMGDGTFAPNATMTRAQFAAIVVRSLGLTPKYSGTFADAPSNQWYAAYVDTAAAYGIVNGVGNGRFDPTGTISREQAATMVARAAKLCGMDTAMSDAAVRDMLAQFGDCNNVSDYARGTLAFCYREGILDQNDLEIRARQAVLRAEVAQMLYNMLGAAGLL